MTATRALADIVLLAAAGPVSGPDGQRAAKLELSRPEYHRDDPSLAHRALNWLFDQLGLLNGATVGQSALVVLAVILVVVTIFLIIRAGRPARGVNSSDSVPDLLSPAGGDHGRAAQDHFEAGNYAEALRLWLRVIVQDLERRGVLDVRPGRTAEDIARIGGSQLPDAAIALRAATDAFDAIWFGGRVATTTDAIAGRAAVTAVRNSRVRSGPVHSTGYAVPH